MGKSGKRSCRNSKVRRSGRFGNVSAVSASICRLSRARRDASEGRPPTEENRMGETAKPTGPDLAQGVPAGDIPDGGSLVGHVGESNVLVARRGAEIFAIDASCSHYGGPLGDGLVVDDTVRCPWHHACFSLRTGEALGPPALSPLGCWQV